MEWAKCLTILLAEGVDHQNVAVVIAERCGYVKIVATTRSSSSKKRAAPHVKNVIKIKEDNYHQFDELFDAKNSIPIQISAIMSSDGTIEILSVEKKHAKKKILTKENAKAPR